MPTSKPLRIAVIGAGLSGASCAAALAQAGHAVQVFDKARGPGGRLATRRLNWQDAQGRHHTTALDHGAVGIGAKSAAFQAVLDDGLQAGWLAEWRPALAPDSLPLECGGRLVVAVPGMSAWCRQLLGAVAAQWSTTVTALQRSDHGWQLWLNGQLHAQQVDRVLVALPPAQAAPLLAPHRPDWARHAAVTAMQPCWTLMGVADDVDSGDAAVTAAARPAPWSLWQPRAGVLACVLRNDLRPGRQATPGQRHWVLHARAGWSRRHLERDAGWVQAQLQAALDALLGAPVHWRHAVAHRWRYALPRGAGSAADGLCWWDDALGLGVCGDFLGGTGAEGAWLSARALLQALRGEPAPPPVPCGAATASADGGGR